MIIGWSFIAQRVPCWSATHQVPVPNQVWPQALGTNSWHPRLSTPSQNPLHPCPLTLWGHDPDPWSRVLPLSAGHSISQNHAHTANLRLVCLFVCLFIGGGRHLARTPGRLAAPRIVGLGDPSARRSARPLGTTQRGGTTPPRDQLFVFFKLRCLHTILINKEKDPPPDEQSGLKTLI